MGEAILARNASGGGGKKITFERVASYKFAGSLQGVTIPDDGRYLVCWEYPGWGVDTHFVVLAHIENFEVVWAMRALDNAAYNIIDFSQFLVIDNGVLKTTNSYSYTSYGHLFRF